MQKVIHVSLNGNAYVLEEGGHDALRSYLDGAARALAADPDRSEILCDLEAAIAEKCQRHLAQHKSVVTTAEMEKVLAEMGPVSAPAGVGPEAAGEPKPSPAQEGPREAPRAPPAGAAAEPPPRRLYRVLEGGVLGGLCNGLGAYLGIDANVVRVIFVALALVTHGAWLLVYPILLFVVPAAGTAEERAAARGLPFSAQALIDEAKRQYARLGGELHGSWFRARAERRRWKREWKRQRRAWRQEWRREWWSAPTGPGPAGSPGRAPTYAEQVAAGIVVPVLAFLSAALSVAWLVGVASLLQTGAILGWAPGLPLWGSLLLLVVAVGIVKQPLSYARHALHRNARDGWMLAAWDGILWLGFLLVLGWVAWRASPELRAAAADLPGCVHRVLASLPQGVRLAQ
jgi:phage shock protein PspC (stress-responsive transcriptional regulator)